MLLTAVALMLSLREVLTVGILTYDGGVHFGLLADRDAVPDIGEAAAGLERALAVLTETAR